MAPSVTVTTTIYETPKDTKENLIKLESPKNNALQRLKQNDDEETYGKDWGDYKNNYTTLWGYFETPLKFSNIISITILHLWAVYGFCTYDYLGNWRNVLFGLFMGFAINGFGVTGGAHRLWTHRCYKAKLPLRIILMICYSSAGQNSLLDWVRDHRVHHKFSETDADPHNSKRGFFFAHVGWLMMKKHPEVIRKGKQIDLSDLWEDPVFVFHQKYFVWLKLFTCFVIPTLIPVYCWGSSWYSSFLAMAVARYCLELNFTWSVNSAAHLWGNKPYDKRIDPAENLFVSLIAFGEGWHNYHHTFPWDYKAAELGNYAVNFSTCFIDMFAKIGWAYDLKQPSKELIKRVCDNHGDGTHSKWGHHHREVSEAEECTILKESKKLL